MTLASLRQLCLARPHATERQQWGDNFVYGFPGTTKMFAIISPEDDKPLSLFVKCSPEDFAELTQREGIRPAPYLARSHWVLIEDFLALSEEELRGLLTQAHAQIFQSLPRKVRAQLSR